jgi:hypothetical protein
VEIDAAAEDHAVHTGRIRRAQDGADVARLLRPFDHGEKLRRVLGQLRQRHIQVGDHQQHAAAFLTHGQLCKDLRRDCEEAGASRRVEFFQPGHHPPQCWPHKLRTDVGFDGDDACRQRTARLTRALDHGLLARGAFGALLQARDGFDAGVLWAGDGFGHWVIVRLEIGD